MSSSGKYPGSGMGNAATHPCGGEGPRNPTEMVPQDGGAESSGSVSDLDGSDGSRTESRGDPHLSCEESAERLQKMCAAVRTILECVGEDPDRQGLLRTPKRYAMAIMFLTQGYRQNIWDIINDAIFDEDHHEMVVVKDVDVFSVCEHHLLPFVGRMHIGYVPDRAVIGLSKLPRIAEMFSRRLQVQERLTKEVACAIMDALKPRGVAVVMESSHLCMAMRGVQKSTATTITSCVLGCFEADKKTRDEFFGFVGVRR